MSSMWSWFINKRVDTAITLKMQSFFNLKIPHPFDIIKIHINWIYTLI